MAWGRVKSRNGRADQAARFSRPRLETLEPRWMLAAPLQKFVQPLGGTPNVDWTITYYVDVDPAPGQAHDFTGGDYSFDGHTGLDISLANFAKMDAGVPVFAVADGVVIAAEDGHPDRNVLSQTEPENSITIDHGGGYTTFYTHLRQGLLVSAGQTVKQGQQIGWVGASGNAHWPHLHFAVFENGTPIETYLDPEAYWISPAPYSGGAPGALDSGVTNYDPAADLIERPSEMKAFLQTPGQVAYAWGFFKGLHAGDLIQFAWHKPDGSLLATSDITATAADGPDERYYASLPLPDFPDVGTWHVDLLDNGVKVGEQSFFVGTSGAAEIRVSAGSTYILDGRVTPIVIGGAGGVLAGSAAAALTFTVQNHGTAPLTLGPLNVPTGFSVSKELPASLAPGTSDTFVVELNTIPAGVKSGDISFSTNDADENTFRFPLRGLIVAPPGPEIVVELHGINLTDGSPAPVDLGSVAWGQAALVAQFTVRNVGSQPLIVAGLSVAGDFSVIKGLKPTLPPGDSDTFSIQFSRARVGASEGQISIANSDPDENPFDFFVTAALTSPPIAAPWQNPIDPLNADGDEDVTPTDAVVIINLLNSGLFSGEELPAPTAAFAPPSFYDVDGDNHVTPTDALLIINYLNSQRKSLGEGEAAINGYAVAPPDSFAASADINVFVAAIDLLAAEIAASGATTGHLGKRSGVR